MTSCKVAAVDTVGVVVGVVVVVGVAANAILPPFFVTFKRPPFAFFTVTSSLFFPNQSQFDEFLFFRFFSSSFLLS